MSSRTRDPGNLRLVTLDALPDGFLTCAPRDLARMLPGPTLIHLPGRQPQPLFASVLVHGNELTGFEAVQQVLSRHAGTGLPRALSLFVGNVAAAAAGVRTLPGQNDYNRVWPGTGQPHAPEARVMAEVVDAMRVRRPFASIDIHNNTGLNPHYACVSRLQPEYLALAGLFSRVAVYFQRPLGVQSIAMSGLCPAVTVECGRIGTHDGTTHAAGFLDACLHLSAFPAHAPAPQDIELLKTVSIVRVPPAATMSFDGTAADYRFREDLDRLNFSEVPAGTPLAQVAPGAPPLEVLPGDEGMPVGRWFDVAGGVLRLARPAVPAMLTREVAAVRLDCLCYLMQRIGLDGEPLDDVR